MHIKKILLKFTITSCQKWLRHVKNDYISLQKILQLREFYIKTKHSYLFSNVYDSRPTDQAGTSNKPKTATTTETDRTALNEAASLLEQLGSTAKKPTRAKKRAKRKK